MGKYQVGGVHTLTGEGKRFMVTADDESAALETVRGAGFAPTSVQLEMLEQQQRAYEYDTVSLTPCFLPGDTTGLAQQLKSVISQMARVGWEYLRSDQFQLPRRGGLLGRIMGPPAGGEQAYVLTFRRPLRDRSARPEEPAQDSQRPR